MKKSIAFLLGCFLTASLLLTSCGDDSSPVPSGVDSNAGQTASQGTGSSNPPAKKDQNLNPLTGEYNLKDQAVGKRPASVMVNNIAKAWPQAGLSSADLCYEVVVEGGITRILAVFADYRSMPNVGSVRSVRHYYTDLSTPLNTLFVHWGGSKPGYNAVEDRNIDNIDGMSLYKTAFYRDQNLKKQKGQEFSNFINGELLQKGLEKKNYNTSGKTDPGFAFDPKGEVKGPDAATNVTVKFSGYATAYFEYDAASETYLKSESLTSKSDKLKYKKKQVDSNNDKQIAVDNVFVLYADVHSYQGSNQLMDVDFSRGGSGYYISKGTKTDITWSKPSYKSAFSYRKTDGTELKINPGKSWICIVSDGQKGNTAIK